jgi:hypothetical protein
VNKIIHAVEKQKHKSFKKSEIEAQQKVPKYPSTLIQCCEAGAGAGAKVFFWPGSGSEAGYINSYKMF